MNVEIANTPEYERELHGSLLRRGIPYRMHRPVVEYIMRGRPTGNFLQALFSNGLMDAFDRADDDNICVMAQYVKFLYNDAPVGCYGSPEAYAGWLEARGLSGFRS